jgi:hypothetical protein
MMALHSEDKQTVASPVHSRTPRAVRARQVAGLAAGLL